MNIFFFVLKAAVDDKKVSIKNIQKRRFVATLQQKGEVIKMKLRLYFGILYDLLIEVKYFN